MIAAKSIQGSNIGTIRGDSIDIIDGIKRVITFLNSKEANNPASSEGRMSSLVSASEICGQLVSADGSEQAYKIISGDKEKTSEKPETGDKLIVTNGSGTREYTINIINAALAGKLELKYDSLTKDTEAELVLDYYAGQRTPEAEVAVYIPNGIAVTMENTTVDLIGRGEVALSGFAGKSVGRVASDYKYQAIGTVKLEACEDGQIIRFAGLDLRPDNGVDLHIKISGIRLLNTGEYVFRAELKTKEPSELKSPGTGSEKAVLRVVDTVADFQRVLDKSPEYTETPETYTTAAFTWTKAKQAEGISLYISADDGTAWEKSDIPISSEADNVVIRDLQPQKLYMFRIKVEGGPNDGFSNTACFYSGKLDVRKFGAATDGRDNKDAINSAIAWLNRVGGGTLLFSGGVFKTRTVYLKSNVYLYIDSDAVIEAYRELLSGHEDEACRVYLGMDEPENSWWSYKDYISGTNDSNDPYDNPDNFISKQDVGHCFFANSMFYAQREDNIKIIGTGTINGDGVLNTSDKVFNNGLGNHADKMISLKLCTNFELGGKNIGKDLKYDTSVPYVLGEGQPYYDGEGSVENMLKLDRGGHFVLLSTGCDGQFVHDIYYQKNSVENARDVFDFMATGNVTVTNIFSASTSDDIVKLGSDCSLGFTRPASGFMVRNIIGSTGCNLFQIGSETADDICDACIDNITVLGGNKAGFSISTNDGGNVLNVFLNTGKTGEVFGKSHMSRVTSPFFVSISNRGRIIGAKSVKDGENPRIISNVNIGRIENIYISKLDISDVYGGNPRASQPYASYDSSIHKEFTSAIAGYQMPDYDGVPTPPDGRTTGYIENISFEDVTMTVKGYNAEGCYTLSHAEIEPPELKVGSYNVGNFGIRPAYGYFVRHVKNISFKNCAVGFEKNDDRYAVVFDDVQNAELDGFTMMKGVNAADLIKISRSENINIKAK